MKKGPILLGVVLPVLVLTGVCVATPVQSNYGWGTGFWVSPPLPDWGNPWWGKDWGQNDYFWWGKFPCCCPPPHCPPPTPPATIPAPGAIVLGSMGVAGVGMLRRKFF